MPYRMDKVNEELHKILSDIILTELNEKDASAYLYTVTSVKCSRDLQNATVFVSVLGDKEKSSHGFLILCRHLKKIQSLFSERIHLKYTPRLYLKLDETAAYAERIGRLIDQVCRHEHEEK
ncbi:MAG: 30S ribosome-binding factor RbfA [Candidatus Aureabacteria bacterium]|nr:30S ribosome-binding factor RbfA [Candidatus Auribacterota bacterium]